MLLRLSVQREALQKQLKIFLKVVDAQSLVSDQLAIIATYKYLL